MLLFRFNVTTRKGLGCSAEVQNTPRQRHIFCYTPFNSCNSLRTLLMVKSQSDKIGLLIELKTVAAKTLTVCVLHSRELAKENPKGSLEKNYNFIAKALVRIC